MSKILYFYATRDDVLAVTNEIEATHPIKYVRFGNIAYWPPETFATASEIPHLGVASHPSAVAGETFLVCDVATEIRAQKLKTLTEADLAKSDFNPDSLRPLVGKRRFAVDQLANPDTISFSAGGIWADGTLLRGGIGTASQSKHSLLLMKEFHSAIKARFVKVKAFYVGTEALSLLKAGRRLTGAIQSPPEFDLRLE